MWQNKQTSTMRLLVVTLILMATLAHAQDKTMTGKRSSRRFVRPGTKKMERDVPTPHLPESYELGHNVKRSNSFQRMSRRTGMPAPDEYQSMEQSDNMQRRRNRFSARRKSDSDVSSSNRNDRPVRRINMLEKHGFSSHFTAKKDGPVSVTSNEQEVISNSGRTVNFARTSPISEVRDNELSTTERIMRFTKEDVSTRIRPLRKHRIKTTAYPKSKKEDYNSKKATSFSTLSFPKRFGGRDEDNDNNINPQTSRNRHEPQTSTPVVPKWFSTESPWSPSEISSTDSIIQSTQTESVQLAQPTFENHGPFESEQNRRRSRNQGSSSRRPYQSNYRENSGKNMNPWERNFEQNKRFSARENNSNRNHFNQRNRNQFNEEGSNRSQQQRTNAHHEKERKIVQVKPALVIEDMDRNKNFMTSISDIDEVQKGRTDAFGAPAEKSLLKDDATSVRTLTPTRIHELSDNREADGRFKSIAQGHNEIKHNSPLHHVTFERVQPPKKDFEPAQMLSTSLPSFKDNNQWNPSEPPKFYNKRPSLDFGQFQRDQDNQIRTVQTSSASDFQGNHETNLGGHRHNADHILSSITGWTDNVGHIGNVIGKDSIDALSRHDKSNVKLIDSNEISFQGNQQNHAFTEPGMVSHNNNIKMSTPTKVPGSTHLVTQKTFPYKFWKPEENIINPKNSASDTATLIDTRNRVLHNNKIPDHLLSAGAGPISVPEELVQNSFQMVTAVPSFDIMENPFEKGRKFAELPEVRSAITTFTRGQGPHYYPPQQGESPKIEEPRIVTRNNRIPHNRRQPPPPFRQRPRPPPFVPSQRPNQFQIKPAPSQNAPQRHFNNNISPTENEIKNSNDESNQIKPMIRNDAVPQPNKPSVDHQQSFVIPDRSISPNVPQNAPERFVPHRMNRNRPHRPGPSRNAHNPRMNFGRPVLNRRPSGSGLNRDRRQRRPPSTPQIHNLQHERRPLTGNNRGNFRNNAIQPMNPHQNERESVSSTPFPPVNPTRSHFDVKRPPVEDHQRINSHFSQNQIERISNDRPFGRPQLGNRFGEFNSFEASDRRNSYIAQPPPSLPAPDFHRQRPSHQPHPQRRRRPNAPFRGQYQDRVQEEEGESFWSALSNFDFSALNPFGNGFFSNDYDSDYDRVDPASAATVGGAAAALPASMLIPGGLAVLGAGLGMFYFNYVWYPTPIVRARLMDMMVGQSGMLSDDQQRAITDVSKIYSALSDMGGTIANMSDSSAFGGVRELEEALLSQDCKNRIVCQTYSEFPELFDMTKGMSMLLRDNLKLLDQELLLEYFEAAGRGHFLEEEETCEAFYEECLLPHISVRGILTNLAGVGTSVETNALDKEKQE